MANVKHRTLNVQRRTGDGSLSMFDVECLMFNVRYLDSVRRSARVRGTKEGERILRWSGCAGRASI